MTRPAGLTRRAAADWDRLTGRRAGASDTDPAASTSLPDPVRRWLAHVLVPGVAPPAAVEVGMRGEIRLDAWRPFTAVQRQSPAGGFVWAARATLFGLPVLGFDRFTRGTGQMRWRLLNILPVVSGQGPDVTRSSAGRHAGELLLHMPATALWPAIAWRGLDDDSAVALVPAGGETHEITLRFDRDGRLSRLSMHRWGRVGREGFALHPFGAEFEGELVTTGGVRVPEQVIAGWHFGTDAWAEGQFIRYRIERIAPC